MKRTNILLLLSIAVFTISCKKTSTETGTGTPTTGTNCNVSKMVSSDGKTSSYTYDISNRITKMEETDSSGTTTSTYTYTGNTVTISDSSGYDKVYFLNKWGLADSMHTSLGFFGDIGVKVTYDMFGQPSKMKMSGTVLGSTIDQTVTTEFLNGNLVKEITDDGTSVVTSTYEYFTDKENTLQKYEKATQFMFSNKNLVKSMTSSDGSSENYTYTYDANGKPTQKVTIDDKMNTTSESFTWLCK